MSPTPRNAAIAGLFMVAFAVAIVLVNAPATAVCGNVAVFSGRERDCGWSASDLTYHHDLNVPGLTWAEMGREGDGAFFAAQAVCGVRLRWTNDRERANVRVLMADLPGNTVGQAEIGCRFDAKRQARLWLDRTQKWDAKLFRAVMAHELGHVLGLDHRADDRTSVMYPQVTSVDAFSPADVADLRKLYGPPKAR